MHRRRWMQIALLAAICAGGWGLSSWAQSVAPNTLQWQTNLDDAKRLAAQTNRLLLVHFWSPSCGPCMALERNVFSQPRVQQEIHARFVPVKLNADEYPTTTRQYGINVVPTDLIVHPTGTIVGRMMSPPSPDSYIQQLAIAAGGAGPSASPPNTAYTAAGVPSGQGTPNIQPQPSVPPNAAWGSPPAQNLGSRYGGIVPSATTAGSPAPPGSWQSQQTAPPAVAPPAVPAYSESRYAEFFQRYSTPALGNSPNASTTPVGPPNQQRPKTYPAVAPQATYPQPSMPQSSMLPGGAAATSLAPPLGFDGYSPVALVEQQRWQMGDRRWGAVHRGRTYLFTGPDEQQKFLANPDRYSPAISGQDVVMALDHGQEVEGRRALGVTYQNRIYLFSSEASQRTFIQNRDRYAAEVLQAEAARPTLR